jgi:hypothetical protein
MNIKVVLYLILCIFDLGVVYTHVFRQLIVVSLTDFVFTFIFLILALVVGSDPGHFGF